MRRVSSHWFIAASSSLLDSIIGGELIRRYVKELCFLEVFCAWVLGWVGTEN